MDDEGAEDIWGDVGGGGEGGEGAEGGAGEVGGRAWRLI